MITIRWSDDQKACIESDSTRLHDLHVRPELAVWADLESPDDTAFSLLKDPFDFHPLAIEDSKNERQRPKVEGTEITSFRRPRDRLFSLFPVARSSRG